MAFSSNLGLQIAIKIYKKTYDVAVIVGDW